MATRRAPSTDVVEKNTGFGGEQVHQFVTKLGDNYYVNKDGRRWKMDERFGAGKYQVQVAPPEAEEYAFLKQMMGLKPSDPCIIMKACVVVDGKKLAEDYGFVTPESTRAGQKQFKNDGLHIAVTKATNRVMGMLTAGGFSDPSNVYEHEPVMHYNEATDHVGYVPATGSAQVSFLNGMKKMKKDIVERFGTDAPYYEILHSFGYDKSNDPSLCSNAQEMDSVFHAVSEILHGAQTHPDPEPPTTETDFIDNLDHWIKTIEGANDENKVLIMSDMLKEFLADPAMEGLHHTKGETLGKLLEDKCAKHIYELEVEPFVISIRKAKAIIDAQRASATLAE